MERNPPRRKSPKKKPSKKNPAKKSIDPSVRMWEWDPEIVQRMFAAAGELERRRDDGGDLFMVFLDPGGKIREEYCEEIEQQREIIGAIVGLRTFGTSAEIKFAQEILRQAISVLHWMFQQPNPIWACESSRDAAFKVSGEIVALEYKLISAGHYEDTLRQCGLEYDTETKMAVRKGRKGRPSIAINRFIFLQVIALESKFDGESLRLEIQRRLSRFFPTSELDAGPRGVIARVIENAKRPNVIRLND